MTQAAISLGPELTIAFAAATQVQLAAALPASGGRLDVDLSGVAEFDSAGVQLLLALRHAAGARGTTLQLKGASPVVRDALAVFGLAELAA